MYVHLDILYYQIEIIHRPYHHVCILTTLAVIESYSLSEKSDCHLPLVLGFAGVRSPQIIPLRVARNYSNSLSSLPLWYTWYPCNTFITKYVQRSRRESLFTVFWHKNVQPFKRTKSAICYIELGILWLLLLVQSTSYSSRKLVLTRNTSFQARRMQYFLLHLEPLCYFYYFTGTKLLVVKTVVPLLTQKYLHTFRRDKCTFFTLWVLVFLLFHWYKVLRSRVARNGFINPTRKRHSSAKRIRFILSWYRHENIHKLAQLYYHYFSGSY